MGRKPRTGRLTYGLVQLKCPAGHIVGRVMKKDATARRYNIIDGDFVSRNQNGLMDVHCRRCEAQRRLRVPLRGSWPKVHRLADELQADPERSVADYVLGG